MSDDIRLSIDVDDMSENVLHNIAYAERRALYAAGIVIQKAATDSISGLYTSKNKAVNTGRLRASISFITPTDEYRSIGNKTDALTGRAPDHTLIVGTNVEYAQYVHNGTNKVAARPFLREGFDRAKPEVTDKITKIFKGEL